VKQTASGGYGVIGPNLLKEQQNSLQKNKTQSKKLIAQPMINLRVPLDGRYNRGTAC
jgi:uncharacterized circularly permuted ATP-grasp superfamily protein